MHKIYNLIEIHNKFRNPNIPNMKILFLAVHSLTRIQESKDEKMETEAAKKSDTNNKVPENLIMKTITRIRKWWKSKTNCPETS
jgi:hypothetical protein